MGGTTPQTAIEGLLSGLAHPLIGLDHFIFVIGVGLLAARFTRGFWLPPVFLVGGGIGTAVNIARGNIPFAELGVVLSVLILAAVLLWPKPQRFSLLGAFFGLAGFFHGFALAEAIIGAERAPLIGYLAGLVAIQSAISLGVMLVYRRMMDRRPQAIRRAQSIAGCAALLVAVVALLQA
jgi:urease accessory protein